MLIYVNIVYDKVGKIVKFICIKFKWYRKNFFIESCKLVSIVIVINLYY